MTEDEKCKQCPHDFPHRKHVWATEEESPNRYKVCNGRHE